MTTTQARLHPADAGVLDDAIEFVRTNGPSGVLAQLLPELASTASPLIESACRMHHAAVLLFPPTLDDLCEELRGRGLTPRAITSSVVVRDRLSLRYRQPTHSLDVSIVRVPVQGPDGGSCEIEVFALPVEPGSSLEAIAAGEREHHDEAHVAVEVRAADRLVLHALRSMLADGGRMRPDGGGYNRGESATVLYFRDPEGPSPFTRRLELLIAGSELSVLDSHRRRSREPPVRLLELMTGAWQTQAVAVAAELRLADHLGDHGAATVGQLADATGTDAQSLARLLRYLVNLGVVTATGNGFALTEVGRLLRSDADPPLRPLALLYGGPFYESFGHLIHSVRTGGDAFEHHFGKHHFEYFAENPALAELFDEAMASSAAMFGGVAEIIDFSLACTVVDVGGGNGRLLARILRSAPHLRGMLLERPHALQAARSTLAEAGCADRCDLIDGDFTVDVPRGGDVYVLSRVLHDWDDERCRVILSRCAEAMSGHAMLLVVERLLPEDDAPSLAVPWDIHMLCNVGGRERTASHYAALLGDAGLEVVDRHALPLDVTVLCAAASQGRP